MIKAVRVEEDIDSEEAEMYNTRLGLHGRLDSHCAIASSHFAQNLVSMDRFLGMMSSPQRDRCQELGLITP